MKVSEDDTRYWLGTSNPMAEAVEVITSVANGEYTPENLKQDIADISEYYDAEVDVRQGRKLSPNSEQMAWIEAQNRKIEEAAKNPRKNARIIDKYLEELADYIQSMSAETFESQYAGGFGSGSLSDVGLSSNQLTSTWGSGDFDSASLNSSGHQNVFARAEGEENWLLGIPNESTIIEMWKYHTGNNSEPHHQHQDWFDSLWDDEEMDDDPNPRTRAKLKSLWDSTPKNIREKFSAETHSHTPHDYYTPVGPADTPDVSGYLSHDDRMDIDSFMAEGFAAEYDGPSTLSAALSGARKTDKNGRHLTIIQRLVAKYGIEKGTRIYKHFGVKQKRASPKVRGKTRGTKSGPRRYSEGRVGGYGRSQVYQNGDRTGSWTKSGGHTTSYANSGKAWYQERGYGTPVMGPVPDTALAGKALGEKSRGKFVNPAGIVGYPFVPAQQREQKR